MAHELLTRLLPVPNDTPTPATTPEPPLQLQQELERAWGVLRLQPQRMLQVASGVRDALEVAIVFLVIGAVLSYVGGIITPISINGRSIAYSALRQLATVAVQLLLTVGLIGVMTLVARAFRAPVTFQQLFRVLGYASIVFVLTVFPQFLILALGWWFTIAYVALRSLGQLDGDRALLTVLVGVITLFVVARIMASPLFFLLLWSGHWSPITYF